MEGKSPWDDKILHQTPDAVEEADMETSQFDTSLPELIVFPNPAHSFINLQLNNIPELHNDFLINIYSNTGELMETISPGKDKKLYLPVTDYPIGLYFIKVINRSKGSSNTAVFQIAR